MLSAAVKELQAAKNKIASQIKGLEAEAKKIINAIEALSGLSGHSASLLQLSDVDECCWTQSHCRRSPCKMGKDQSPEGRKSHSRCRQAREEEAHDIGSSKSSDGGRIQSTLGQNQSREEVDLFTLY